jgi:hypothetical protein
MQVYKRNIVIKLFLIRAVIVATPVIIFYSLLHNKVVIALTCVFILFIVSLIKINDLTIQQESFLLHEYYLFSFKYREWLIAKNQIKNLELFRNNEADGAPDSGTWLDLIIIPALIMSGKKGVLIKELFIGNKRKTKRVFLNNKEFGLIENIMKGYQCLHHAST